MRISFTPPFPSAKHSLRRRHPSHRRGWLAALLAAGALFGAGAVQALASPARHQPVVAFDRAQPGDAREHRDRDHDHDRHRRHRHPGAGLTFALHPPPAAPRSPSAELTAASPQPALVPLRVVVLGSPVASPPSPAPALPSNAQPQSPPSSTGGQPAPGLLPPVAVLPAPSPAASAQPLMLPVVLLLTFVAILLVATVLTARRRT